MRLRDASKTVVANLDAGNSGAILARLPYPLTSGPKIVGYSVINLTSHKNATTDPVIKCLFS